MFNFLIFHKLIYSFISFLEVFTFILVIIKNKVVIEMNNSEENYSLNEKKKSNNKKMKHQKANYFKSQPNIKYNSFEYPKQFFI